MGPVERRGVTGGDGAEAFVEIRLKTFKVMAFPEELFQFDEPATIYISRAKTFQDLRRKFQRVLGNIPVQLRKATANPLMKFRIWKCSREAEYLEKIGYKYNTFTDSPIDATSLIDLTFDAK